MRKFTYPLITKLDFAVLLGVTLSILLANVALFGQECEVLRTDVVRLHILANSNSEADQSVKLKVRDRILADVGSVFASPQSQQDAKDVARKNLPAVKAAAEHALAENGVSLPVSVELCNMYFNTRQYGEIALPAGYYDAVRVTLGTGEGKNWWCVMYPPMCVSTALADGMPEMDEIQQLNGEPMFKPKLAVVELVEDILDKLS